MAKATNLVGVLALKEMVVVASFLCGVLSVDPDGQEESDNEDACGGCQVQSVSGLEVRSPTMMNKLVLAGCLRETFAK